jgi:hypothetical protein
LRAKSMWKRCCDKRKSENKLQYCDVRSNHGSGPSRAEPRSISTIIDARGRRKCCPGRVLDSHRKRKDNAETLRQLRVRREAPGFLDGVRLGLVDWQDAVEL